MSLEWIRQGQDAYLRVTQPTEGMLVDALAGLSRMAAPWDSGIRLRLDLSGLPCLDRDQSMALQRACVSLDQQGWRVELVGAAAASDILNTLFPPAPVDFTRDVVLDEFALDGDDLPPSLTACGINAGLDGIFQLHYGLPIVHDGALDRWSGYIDPSPLGLSPVSPLFFRAIQAGGLALHVRTSSTFSLDMRQVVDAMAMARFASFIGDFTSIAVAEATCNAVIHGNLAIPGGIRSQPGGYARFGAMIATQLADPALADRRLEVCMIPWSDGGLRVTVSDQGQGMNLASMINAERVTSNKEGKGLGIIRQSCSALWTEDDGRRLVLCFAAKVD